MSYFVLDLIQFIVINCANILISIIFISRVKKKELEHILGILYIILGAPTLLLTIFNIHFQREWWIWIFQLLFVFFIIFELIVDYVKKIEFRNPRNKRILIPYLILYFVSIILIWGLTWTLGIVYGGITGITYFFQLGCSIYAGKHGVG